MNYWSLEYCGKSGLQPRSGLGMLNGMEDELCFVVKLFRLDYDGVLSYKTVLALMPMAFPLSLYCD
jgi:hypothetical protein